MSRILRFALLACAAVVAACSQDTPTSAKSPDEPSHSGYLVASGRTCNPDVDPACTNQNGGEGGEQ